MSTAVVLNSVNMAVLGIQGVFRPQQPPVSPVVNGPVLGNLGQFSPVIQTAARDQGRIEKIEIDAGEIEVEIEDDDDEDNSGPGNARDRGRGRGLGVGGIPPGIAQQFFPAFSANELRLRQDEGRFRFELKA